MRISFIPEDISDPSVIVDLNKCFLVEHYRYGANRSLDERGIPYGETVLTTLELTIRVLDSDICNSLYKYIEKDVPIVYSIIFDVFDHQYPKSYDGISFRGYIVNINEIFNSGGDGHILFILTILLNRVTYVGKDSIKQLFITQ